MSAVREFLTKPTALLCLRKVKTYTYKVHLDPEPDGGFTVTVPSLPGCVTWGKNYEHALQMAQECIEGFLEALVKQGESIPEEPISAPIDTLIQVKSPAHV